MYYIFLIFQSKVHLSKSISILLNISRREKKHQYFLKSQETQNKEEQYPCRFYCVVLVVGVSVVLVSLGHISRTIYLFFHPVDRCVSSVLFITSAAPSPSVPSSSSVRPAWDPQLHQLLHRHTALTVCVKSIVTLDCKWITHTQTHMNIQTHTDGLFLARGAAMW